MTTKRILPLINPKKYNSFRTKIEHIEDAFTAYM